MGAGSRFSLFLRTVPDCLRLELCWLVGVRGCCEVRGTLWYTPETGAVRALFPERMLPAVVVGFWAVGFWPVGLNLELESSRGCETAGLVEAIPFPPWWPGPARLAAWRSRPVGCWGLPAEDEPPREETDWLVTTPRGYLL